MEFFLSQLHHGFPSSAGKPAPSSKLTSEFVQIVLELTITAYQAMNRDRVARQNWEENTFTYWLERYITNTIFDYNYPLQVKTRHRPATPQMYEGTQPTIQAKEIDLSFNTWERIHLQKHFVWEAKLVGDKRIDSRYKDLHTEYIHEAIYRFIERFYADGLDDAGVLGYVLAGAVPTIVNDINTSMGNITKNPPLPGSNHLRLVEPIKNFEYVYQSHHTRIDETGINLHHLFLPFDF